MSLGYSGCRSFNISNASFNSFSAGTAPLREVFRISRGGAEIAESELKASQNYHGFVASFAFASLRAICFGSARHRDVGPALRWQDRVGTAFKPPFFVSGGINSLPPVSGVNR